LEVAFDGVKYGLLQYAHVYGSHHKKTNEDRPVLSAVKYRPMIIVFRNIRYRPMRIFAEFLGPSGRESSMTTFFGFYVATSKTLEIKPALLYGDNQSFADL